MGRGRTVYSKQDLEDYRADPFLTLNPGTVYCWLPDIWSMEADGLDTAGISFSSHQFVGKGRVMCNNNPKPYNLLKTNPPKFNTAQKGPKLARSALPVDAPNHLVEVARGMYNASVAANSSKVYGAVIPHMRKLEAVLGRTFTWPLSEQDSTLLLVYLLSKGFSADTVRKTFQGPGG